MLIVPSYIGMWLLQFLCIVFSIVLYQAFFRKKIIWKNIQTVLYGILCGIAIMICMSFPVAINRDYLLDFRFIPLMIGFIFGGYRVGFLLSLLIIAYRFVIGGTGFYIGGLGIVALFLIAFHYILPRSEKWNSYWKNNYPYILFALSLLFLAVGTQFLDGHTFTKNETIMWLWFSMISFLTLWIVLYLQKVFTGMEEMTEKVIQLENNHTTNHLLQFIFQQFLSPLKSVQESLQTVQEEPLTSRQVDFFKQMEMKINQADQLLTDYLEFMDKNQTSKMKGNFTKELEDIVNVMKVYAKKCQVELVYTSTVTEDVCIRGDQAQLRIAILNIIKNAIEACESNGKVNICLHEMLKEVYIVIEDNGSGIPANILRRLGQPLPSEKVNGTGLGLVSTYKIAESVGGRVEVQTMPNKGTIFSLYFPKWAVCKTF